jgi:calcineurin-like phosphoesterase family protein
MIYVSSDLHFGHDRGFIYEPRGFSSIQEHDEAIIERFNSVVRPDDDLYLLGDQMLGDNEHGLDCLRQLNGKLHILFGNHDTDTRKGLYLLDLSNAVEILGYAEMLKYRKWRFYLSHYPTITDNLNDISKPWEQVKCLYGHTHQKTNFYNDNPLLYHVGVDSHDCYPVSIDQIVEDIKMKFLECKEML